MAGMLPLLTIQVVVSILFPLLITGNGSTIQIYAILSRENQVDRDDAGVLKLLADVPQSLQLIGMNMSSDLEIAFTPSPSEIHSAQDSCDSVKRIGSFKPKSVNGKGTSAEFEVKLDKLDPGEKLYYLCMKQANTWHYAGNETWLQVAIQEVESKEGPIFPLPVQILIIIFLLFLSGLFSGLNLGLMALDKTELQIIEKCGSPSEKKFAKTITPLRKRGNFLLCTLLLGNVMVNSTATILLDDLSNGVVAVVVSTMCIVIFGEIIPQAVCSRHGLAVGARTAWITRFFMLVTFPLSFPISLMLDKILGEEIGQVYDKEKLQELIRMTADHKVLQNDEANIIAGALQLANKRVEDVMTKMEDVYMLDINTVLDFETMAEILKSGYTRVPVYDGDMTNIVHLLNTKELALIDPDDNTALKTVCRFYDHQPLLVDYDVKLDAMLQDFLQGNSHMAIVQRLQNEGDHDPYYENIGVVTLEDVIEEIIQSEIIDETDILTDNRRKKPRQRQRQLDYNVFEQKQEEHGPRISQQVAFAAFQYLSTAVEPFKEQYIVRNVLKQLIRQNIFITLTPNSQDPSKNYLFKRGMECDYFILLLEGHVEVEIGKENLIFESGPFNYFGVECFDCLRDIKIETFRDSKDLRALPPYIPDFSVRVVTAVQFLRIRRLHYLAARRTSYMMSKSQSEDKCHEEAFHTEWHRTVASHSISRNNSAAGMSDMVDINLSPLEIVQKRALISESSLNDCLVNNSSPRFIIAKSDAEDKFGKDTCDKEENISLDSPKININGSLIASISSPADQQHKLQMTLTGSAGDLSRSGRSCVEKSSDGAVLLPNRVGDGDRKAATMAAESESSPEEGSMAKREDKVPLVNTKDGRTTSGAQKGWAEEKDESSPLMSKEKAEGRMDNS